jgi:hypothetical protein
LEDDDGMGGQERFYDKFLLANNVEIMLHHVVDDGGEVETRTVDCSEISQI